MAKFKDKSVAKVKAEDEMATKVSEEMAKVTAFIKTRFNHSYSDFLVPSH